MDPLRRGLLRLVLPPGVVLVKAGVRPEVHKSFLPVITAIQDRALLAVPCQLLAKDQHLLVVGHPPRVGAESRLADPNHPLVEVVPQLLAGLHRPVVMLLLLVGPHRQVGVGYRRLVGPHRPVAVGQHLPVGLLRLVGVQLLLLVLLHAVGVLVLRLGWLRPVFRRLVE